MFIVGVAQAFISRVPRLSPIEVVLIAAHAADRIVGRKDTESRAAPAPSAPFGKIHAMLSTQKWDEIFILAFADDIGRELSTRQMFRGFKWVPLANSRS